MGAAHLLALLLAVLELVLARVRALDQALEPGLVILQPLRVVDRLRAALLVVVRQRVAELERQPHLGVFPKA